MNDQFSFPSTSSTSMLEMCDLESNSKEDFSIYLPPVNLSSNQELTIQPLTADYKIPVFTGSLSKLNPNEFSHLNEVNNSKSISSISSSGSQEFICDNTEYKIESSTQAVNKGQFCPKEPDLNLSVCTKGTNACIPDSSKVNTFLKRKSNRIASKKSLYAKPLHPVKTPVKANLLDNNESAKASPISRNSISIASVMEKVIEIDTENNLLLFQWITSKIKTKVWHFNEKFSKQFEALKELYSYVEAQTNDIKESWWNVLHETKYVTPRNTKVGWSLVFGYFVPSICTKFSDANLSFIKNVKRAERKLSPFKSKKETVNLPLIESNEKANIAADLKNSYNSKFLTACVCQSKYKYAKVLKKLKYSQITVAELKRQNKGLLRKNKIKGKEIKKEKGKKPSLSSHFPRKYCKIEGVSSYVHKLTLEQSYEEECLKFLPEKVKSKSEILKTFENKYESAEKNSKIHLTFDEGSPSQLEYAVPKTSIDQKLNVSKPQSALNIPVYCSTSPNPSKGSNNFSNVIFKMKDSFELVQPSQKSLPSSSSTEKLNFVKNPGLQLQKSCKILLPTTKSKISLNDQHLSHSGFNTSSNWEDTIEYQILINLINEFKQISKEFYTDPSKQFSFNCVKTESWANKLQQVENIMKERLCIFNLYKKEIEVLQSDLKKNKNLLQRQFNEKEPLERRYKELLSQVSFKLPHSMTILENNKYINANEHFVHAEALDSSIDCKHSRQESKLKNESKDIYKVLNDLEIKLNIANSKIYIISKKCENLEKENEGKKIIITKHEQDVRRLKEKNVALSFEYEKVKSLRNDLQLELQNLKNQIDYFKGELKVAKPSSLMNISSKESHGISSSMSKEYGLEVSKECITTKKLISELELAVRFISQICNFLGLNISEDMIKISESFFNILQEKIKKCEKDTTLINKKLERSKKIIKFLTLQISGLNIDKKKYAQRNRQIKKRLVSLAKNLHGLKSEVNTAQQRSVIEVLQTNLSPNEEGYSLPKAYMNTSSLQHAIQELKMKNNCLVQLLAQEKQIKEAFILKNNQLEENCHKLTSLLKQEHCEASRQLELQLAMYCSTADRYRELMRRIEDSTSP